MEPRHSGGRGSDPRAPSPGDAAARLPAEMNRRELLHRMLRFSAAGLLVPPTLRGLLSPGVLGGGPALADAGRAFAGRTLVLIHQNGGNDGLNTVVPFQDPLYYQARPNLAIPPDQAVPIAGGTGLHPSLAPLSSLYENGRMAVIQGVGYPDQNLSHFRSTDIWFSASDSDETVETGWLARFLERMFPSFPNHLPDSPFALQQSFAHRVPLTGERGVTGVVVDNPDTFYSLVNANYSGPWNDELPDTRGGEELAYARQIDIESFEYAEAIQAAAENGTNTVAYPGSALGLQLEIVAKLISGGLDTPVFLTAEFGFDTHAGQAGPHDVLMASIGQSVAAFLQDLANQGLDEKVVALTTSEFGRRVAENVSLGTDHGSAAPLFAFGRDVQGGIFGHNPDLSDLDPYGNLLLQHDFRSVYAEVLRHHFGASETVAADVLFEHFEPIGFLDAVTPVEPEPSRPARDRILPVHPHPVSVSRLGRITLAIDLAAPGPALVETFDVRGRRVARLAGEERDAGRHGVVWDLRGLAAGTYFVRMRTARGETTRKLTLSR
ncbi:MAG: DUF1501 domain-containing protein [Candidatus Eisenbacteria bacterium]|nr:DUF1501 domain-containing protein [Candidatus Latescibacterota bacterium]MBD3301075.1 DUF1501 domain-containing protein [Candidatus Eisenbacteria bacterium]